VAGSPHSAASSAIVATPPLAAIDALLDAITALRVATNALRVAIASANIKFGGITTDTFRRPRLIHVHEHVHMGMCIYVFDSLRCRHSQVFSTISTSCSATEPSWSYAGGGVFGSTEAPVALGVLVGC